MHQVLQQGGEVLLCTSCPTRSLTLLFLSSPRARTRRASTTRARPRRSRSGTSPSSRRTPPPTRVSRSANRATTARCASTQPRFTPTIFPASDPPLPLAAGAGRRQVRGVRLLQPEAVGSVKEAQEGGWLARSHLPEPLQRRREQADQEGGEGGMIPSSLPTRPPHRHIHVTHDNIGHPPRHATLTKPRLTNITSTHK